MDSNMKAAPMASPDSSLFEDWANASVGSNCTETKKPRVIKRRHRLLTLGVKLNIINEVERGTKKSLVCKQYKLAHSTLSTILANKDDIRRNVENSDYCPQLKRIRKSKYQEMEEQLWEWCKEMTQKDGGKSLTNPIICKKALELAHHLGMSDFNANSGWICRFRSRRGLRKTPAAKLAKVEPPPPVNPKLIKQWNSNILPSILKTHDPNDIFLAHETGLFFRCTPESTLPLLGERCKSGGLPKDRLTVMLVCNMTGTEKLPLFVVGRFARPKSLKYVQTLPTEYVFTKKVWMLPIFFEEWVSKFDKMMQSSWRRVTLFVAPNDSHTHVENLSSVSLVFLPPDRNYQPANQGIIETLKMNYRRIVVQRYLDKVEQIGPYSKLSVSVLDALLWLREAWQKVTPECITEGFKKAGISLPNLQTPDLNLNGLHQTANSSGDDFYAAFQKLANSVSMDSLITAEKYLTIDSHLLTIGTLTSCEMMVAKKEALRQDVEDEEADDQDAEPDSAPSITEAKSSLSTLLRYFEYVKGEQESFSLISTMEHFVHKLTRAPQKQTTILDFFLKRPNKKSKVPKKRYAYFFPRS